jgi:hypothetical protein
MHVDTHCLERTSQFCPDYSTENRKSCEALPLSKLAIWDKYTYLRCECTPGPVSGQVVIEFMRLCPSARHAAAEGSAGWAVSCIQLSLSSHLLNMF